MSVIFNTQQTRIQSTTSCYPEWSSTSFQQNSSYTGHHKQHTYDIHFPTQHTSRQNLITQTTPAGRQEKKSLSILYMQSRPIHLLGHPPCQKQIYLQTTHKRTLTTITGCLATTNIHHLHNEKKIHPVQFCFSMLGTQFFATALHLLHPNLSITNQHTPGRNKNWLLPHFNTLYSQICFPQ